jgi:cytidine kinase
MQSPDLIVVGHLSLDNYVIHSRKVAEFDIPAGNALGAAVGAACWQANIGVVSRAGVDFPMSVLDTLSSAGVDLQGVHHLASRSLRFWILQEGENPSRIAFPFGDADFEMVSPSIDDLPVSYMRARVAHIAPMPLQRQLEFSQFFKQKGMIVSLDPLPPSYAGDVAANRALVLEALSHVDVFSPGKAELDDIFPGMPYSEIAKLCYDQGVSVMIVRAGADGSYVYTSASGEIGIPALAVDVIETSGAGDAYCGGFLSEYLRSRDPVESALRGAVSASFMLEQWGRLKYVTAYSEARRRLLQIRRLLRGSFKVAS